MYGNHFGTIFAVLSRITIKSRSIFLQIVTVIINTETKNVSTQRPSSAVCINVDDNYLSAAKLEQLLNFVGSIIM